MLTTKTTLRLCMSLTMFMLVLMPIYGEQLIAVSKIFGFLIPFITLSWVFILGSLGMSFGILMKMGDRNHWYTPSFLGTVYWLLTKEARAVANDYYQFNPNKGAAK
jgi:hypothetical protein